MQDVQGEGLRAAGGEGERGRAEAREQATRTSSEPPGIAVRDVDPRRAWQGDGGPRQGRTADPAVDGALTAPGACKLARPPQAAEALPMNQPLTNFQIRDVEALLHPYTNAVALRDDRAAWSSSAARACASTTRPGAALHRGDGRALVLPASASTTPSSSRRRASRCRSCPTTTSSAARATSRRSSSPRRSRRSRRRMARVFYQTSGSEANDTQIKFAWYYNNALGRPKKKKIVSRHQGLPRRHHRRRLADRAAQQPPRLRPAGRASATPPRRTTGRAPSPARARRPSPPGSPPSSTR